MTSESRARWLGQVLRYDVCITVQNVFKQK